MRKCRIWPKFTSNLWYRTSDGGFAAMLYLPSRVSTTLPSAGKVTVAENTAYPFEENIDIVFEDVQNSAKFPFTFRIPSWNYALTQCEEKDMATHYMVDASAVSRNMPYPWNGTNAPLRIRTSAKRVKNWVEYHNMAGPLTFSCMFRMPVVKNTEEIELIPYGCTTLRITEFPFSGKHKAFE